MTLNIVLWPSQKTWKDQPWFSRFFEARSIYSTHLCSNSVTFTRYTIHLCFQNLRRNKKKTFKYVMYLLKEFKKFWHILEAWCHASSYVIDRSYNWFGANDRLLVKSIWNCCFWPCVGCPRLANVYLVPRRKVPISYVHIRG